MSQKVPRTPRTVGRDQDFFALAKPPLLLSQDRREFIALRQSLSRDIRPRDTVEQMYVSEFAILAWELLALWRCRTFVINAAFHDAVEDLVFKFAEPDEDCQARAKALRDVAVAWFTVEQAKAQVIEILRNFNLDEGAIEAEAIRRSTNELEKLDRLIASLESRRDKMLRRIREYRDGEARSRANAAKIIDADTIKDPAIARSKPSEA